MSKGLQLAARDKSLLRFDRSAGSSSQFASVTVDARTLQAKAFFGDDATALKAQRPWRPVSPSTAGVSADPLVREIAEAELAAASRGKPDTLSALSRMYTVPPRVAAIARAALESSGELLLHPEALTAAARLAGSDQVPATLPLLLHKFFKANPSVDGLRAAAFGGEPGALWAESMAAKVPWDAITAGAGGLGPRHALPGINTDEPILGLVDLKTGKILALFNAAGQVLSQGEWAPLPVEEDPLEIYSDDALVPLDEPTALYAAASLFDYPDTPVDLSAAAPEEAELFRSAAHSLALDFPFLERLVAAAPPGEGYTSEERAKNADSQLRDATGRFAKVGDQGAVKSSGVAGKIAAVKLDTGQLLVEAEDGQKYLVDASDFEIGAAGHEPIDPAAISDVLPSFNGILAESPDSSGPLVRAQLSQELPLLSPADIEREITEYEESVTAARQAKASEFPTSSAVTAASGAEPTDNGQLTPETSDVPPIYFAIVDPEDVRAVFELVALCPASDTTSSAATFKRASGKWLPAPEILQDLRSPTPPAVVKLEDSDYQAVLEQVDTTGSTVAEQDQEEPLVASAEFEPILALAAAGGADRNRGGAEHLRRYWTTGKGGVEIGWNSPGDWKRCVKKLSKYLGVRSKGYCFTGDTEFLTRDGVMKFEDAVGTEQMVLTSTNPEGNPSKKNGHWVQAPIVSFGEQPVLSVNLRRGKLRKTVRATPEHRWFASKNGRNPFYSGKADIVTTIELAPGMVLASLQPKQVAKSTQPSPFGIAAGLVFGDGALEAGGALIDLWGDKNQEFERFFEGSSMSPRKLASGVLGTRVRGLPKAWKALPSLEEGPQYLAGWLAGYIAADGNVSSTGSVHLASANRANLEFAATVANRLGLTVHPVSKTLRAGFEKREKTPLYKLAFARETFPEQLLIGSEHRRRFESNSARSAPIRWTVESVEDLGESEEVFCAVVPDTESFALADYVWTHNCSLRHREMTGMWPGDRKNRTASGAFDILSTAAVIRASAFSAQAALAQAKVDGKPYLPTPVKASDVDAGRSGRAFRIPLVVPEGISSGDTRVFRKGSLGLRTFPLPLLWQPFTGEGHDKAVIVGRIDHVERVGYGLGEAYGVLDVGPYAKEAQRLIEAGMLRWVSVDLDKFEEDKLANKYDPNGKIHIKKGRMMAATLVAKPAFQECTIELLPLAGATVEEETMALTASMTIVASIPVEPPAAWFENPALAYPTPINVTDDGQVFGHIATWDTPHLGLNVPPPRSRTDYAYFHSGVIRTAEGTDVKVGQLTLSGGHAPLHLDAASAARHYDDTASAVADLHVGEDAHGIWVAGALRPGVTPIQVRALRASAPSGDWRSINYGPLELIAICQVNVPGYNLPRTLAASAAPAGQYPNALVAAGTAELQRLVALQNEQSLEELKALSAAAASRVYLALDVDGYLREFKDFSPEKRQQLAEQRLALPSGSFPIETVADLRRAIQAYNKAEEDEKPQVRRHIVRRARELEKPEMVPSDWAEKSLTASALDTRDRFQAVVASARLQHAQEQLELSAAAAKARMRVLSL